MGDHIWVSLYYISVHSYFCLENMDTLKSLLDLDEGAYDNQSVVFVY